MSPTTINGKDANATPRIPRVAFKKSRSGCKRCKERKVKCDEVHPTCHNCKRHKVACEYVAVPTKRANGGGGSSGGSGGEQRRASSSATSAGEGQRRKQLQLQQHEQQGESIDDDFDLEPGKRQMLELQLLHHYLTVVTHTFSAADNATVLDIWTKLVVRTAFDYPFLLNSILSFSALHVARTTRERAGGFAPIEDSTLLPSEMRSRGDASLRTLIDAERAYRIYLNRAFRLQRETIATADINADNANALLFSSILLSYQSLHVDRGKSRPARRRRRVLHAGGPAANGGDAQMQGAGQDGVEADEEEEEDDATEADADGEGEETYRPPTHWLRMVRGIYQTCLASARLVEHDAVIKFLAQQGGEPNFLDPDSLADPGGLEPFRNLLDWDRQPEPADDDDDGGPAAVDEATRVAYERALAYVGTVYLGMRRGEDDRVLFRRIIGLGFATPERFIALVERGRPRALVIMAYHLSMASRLDHHWLFRGVAEREVRGLRTLVPAEWQWAMEWAMTMLRFGAEESGRAAERARCRPPSGS